MFSIYMASCDIVLCVDWLHNLGPIIMEFKELYMIFQQDGNLYNLEGITVGSLDIVSSRRIEKLLKKGYCACIS